MFILLSLCSCEEQAETSRLKSSMKLVFEDDFNQGSLDTLNWLYYSLSPKPFDRLLPRGNCNFENAALLQKDNILLANGCVHLIAKKESQIYRGVVDGDEGRNLGCELIGQKPFEFNLDYTSASLFSKKGYNLGYFECRAKIPCAEGLYPVFWLWHHDELVVFEFFGNSSEHFVSSHNKEKYVTTKFSQADYCLDFHTYGLNWTTDCVTWYFDGDAIWEVCRDDVRNRENLERFPAPVNDTYTMTEALPDIKDRWLSPNISLRMYEWSQSIADERLPEALIIDYVKIYQNETTD